MNGIKWSFKYVTRISKSYFVSLIFLVLMSVSNLGMIGTQKWIIDYIFVQRRYDLLVVIILLFVLSIMFYYIFQTISQLLLVKNELSVRKALTNDLMNYYGNISTEQYKMGRIADFTNYFTNDVINAANTISNYIPKGVQNIINTIMLFVLILYSDPLIASIVVSFGIIYIVAGRKFSHIIKNASKELQVERVKFVTNIEETISSSREIIANHNMKWALNLFRTNANQYLHKNLRETKLINKSAFFSDTIKWGLTLIVLGYGGYLVMKESLTIGTYIILFHFTTQLMQSMHSVYDFFINLASKSTYFDRLKNIIEFEKTSEGVTSIDNQEIRSIEFRNIDFSYGNDYKMALKNLSFVIPKGKKIAFVGSSGGGKSTVIQLMAKFYNPIKGSILLNDISYEVLSKESLLSKIAIVFQEPYIFPDTIRNNIKLGREVSDSDMENICRKVCAHEFIDNLPEKYDTILGEKGIDLSGGQRQRISIARALVNSPEILILDEATSGLDLETERKVQKAIDDTREGLTTITVAHRISTIVNSDIIFVMKDGTVVAQGPHKSLIHTSEDYKELLKNEGLIF